VSSLFVGGLAEAQTSSWPTERPPQPLPARDIKFPPLRSPDPAQCLQVVRAASTSSRRSRCASSSARAPRRIQKDKLGLAHLAASLLDQGTTTSPAQDMNDDVDSSVARWRGRGYRLTS